MNKTSVLINTRKLIQGKNQFYLAFAFFSFVLPLLVSSSTNELYEFPKMYFVYFIGSLLIAIYLLFTVVKGKKLKRVPLLVKLYILSFILSTIYSIHIYTSFWGYYTRFNDGLISTLVFFGLYVVARNTLSQDEFAKVFKIILFSAIPISLVAISQHESITRVYSTFGQANWLAQFFAMILPLSAYLFIADVYPLLWFVVTVLGFTGLWFTYSMSGIIGLVCAFVVLFLLYRKSLFVGIKNRPNVYKLSFLLFVFLLIAVTNLGVFSLRVSDVVNDAKKLITNRIFVYAQTEQSTQSSESSAMPAQRNLSDTGFIRGGLWRGTLDLIFSSPVNALVGTGPETYPYAFQHFRPRELNYSSEWNFVFNKPHNYYLELAAEHGLIGLIMYLLLVIKLFRGLNKEYIPSFVAFLVTNTFGWPTVFTTFVFWMFLASLKEENA